MKSKLPKYPRILAVAPSTRGFGFAVVEGLETLVDWGVKSVRRDKNAGCLKKLEELIGHYRPDLFVLEDPAAKDSWRSKRIRELGKQMGELATQKKVNVALYTREQTQRALLSGATGTKHTLAEAVANRFPDELGFRLPPKRRPWMSEDYRMAIFDAVALALMIRHTRQSKRTHTHLPIPHLW